MNQKSLFITLCCFISLKADPSDRCRFNSSVPIIAYLGQDVQFECYVGESFKSCELVKGNHELDQQCLYKRKSGLDPPHCSSRIQHETSKDKCIFNILNVSMKGKLIYIIFFYWLLFNG